MNGTAYYFQVAAVNVVGETRSLEVSAVPAVVGWTPASLVPMAWFDASNAGSVTTVGTAGHVSQWNDLSGHGYHVTQATDASRPVTGVATVNRAQCGAVHGFPDGHSGGGCASAAVRGVFRGDVPGGVREL